MGWLRRRKQERAQISIGDPAFLDFFGMGRNLAGISVGEFSSLGVSSFWRAVSVLTGTVAALPLKTYRDVAEVRQRARSFLDDPAGFEGQTPYEWVETVMAHLIIHGNAYLVHVHGGAGQILGLLPVHPTAVSVELRPDLPGGKLFNVTLIDGTQRTFTAVDLTHIPSLRTDPNGIGLSLLSVARNSMGTSIAADNSASRMFANGALISGLVTPADGEDITEADAKQIKQGLRANMLGHENAGDIAVINRKLKFDRWSMSNEDAQFLESRRFQVEEVSRWTGVPPHLLMDMERQSSWGTGLIEQNQAFARFTLQPWTTRIEQRLSRLLPAPRFVEFDYTGLVRPTPAEEVRLLLEEVNGGLISLNEARAVRNMPPVEGGDTLRLPVGSLPPEEGVGVPEAEESVDA